MGVKKNSKPTKEEQDAQKARRILEIKEEKSKLAKEEKELKEYFQNELEDNGMDGMGAGNYVISTKEGSPSFASTLKGLPASQSQNKLTAELLETGDTRFVNSSLNKVALYDLQQKGDKATLELLDKFGLQLRTKNTVEVTVKVK